MFPPLLYNLEDNEGGARIVPKFTQRPLIPKSEAETLFSLLNRSQNNRNPTSFTDSKTWFKHDFRMFVDNPPSWNQKFNSYVYNFKGRVTEASIKNF